jgi:hypothetical protein
MDEAPIGIACPRCNKTLQATKVAGPGQLAACNDCGKRVLMDGGYQQAVALATANGGWIEKVFWCEKAQGSWSTLLVLCIELPLTMLKFAGPAVVLLSLYLLRGDPFANTRGMPFRTWLLIPGAILAGYLALWFVKWGIERCFPSQFATQANFIVSSRGIVLAAQYIEPFLLPWSAILHYSWTSHINSMTSQIVLEYSTAANDTARVILEGEEKTQPLGELVDILDARFKKQE